MGKGACIIAVHFEVITMKMHSQYGVEEAFKVRKSYRLRGIKRCFLLARAYNYYYQNKSRVAPALLGEVHREAAVILGRA